MITVKIPAAIRVCSPVVFLDHPGVVVAADDRAPADRMGEWVMQWSDDGPDEYMAFNGSTVSVAAAELALIISDPTGAAHLAWWLRDQPRRDPETVRADLAAAGTFAGAVIDVIVRAADGSALFPRELELLRDYAHHIAGVTNG